MSMTTPSNPLSYAVRFRVLAHYSGQLCMILSVLTLPPLVASLVLGDLQFALWTAISVVVLGAGGALLVRVPAESNLQNNEAMVIATLIFLIAPLAMVPPMMAAGLGAMDSVFEAVSGVTTTGLSVLTDVENTSTSVLFLRSWMQWYGGLGFVVLSLALLSAPSVSAKRLSAVQGEEPELVGSMRVHSRRVVVVYSFFTLFGIGVLLLLGLSPFSAIIHVLSSVSTGGFSNFQDSLASMSPWLQAAILVGSTACAISFALYFNTFYLRRTNILKDIEARMLAILAVIAAGMIFLFTIQSGNSEWGQAAWHAVGLAFSAQSTTGYATMDVGELDAGSKFVLMGSMFIGGDMGSTAGGIKIVRFLIFLRLLQVVMRRTSASRHAVVEARLQDRKLDTQEALDAICLVLMFVAVIVLSWFVFLAYGKDPLDSLFDIVSATGTVGLSAGLTGVDLPPVLKSVLCLDMLLGRVELIALLTVLYPRTWVGRRAQS